jgi:hypothetical protein
MKVLKPSYADPHNWRASRSEPAAEWKVIRQKILHRDNHTCQYCGFRSDKYMIVDHISADPGDNSDGNLQTICQWCNLVKHAGQGCVVQGVVDLYKKSNKSQIEVIQITRDMRKKRLVDNEIIKALGLKGICAFKMDKQYLGKLTAFVTSRKPEEEGMFSSAMAYYKESGLT